MIKVRKMLGTDRLTTKKKNQLLLADWAQKFRNHSLKENDAGCVMTAKKDSVVRKHCFNTIFSNN